MGNFNPTSVLTRRMGTLTIANAAQNPATGKVLEECATYFNETVGMLNLSGLEGGTATLDVHYALDNVQFCENALGGAKVDSRAISDAIDDWKKYFFVAYATVEIIEDETPSGP
ncbi:hypothetical protein GH714_020174 [Hevea brasiliensis]|uniref:Pectinesterase inhibitor domain-containing protein n=1 Tax=Hevea brasiliensis TaxID=3981 RepID=A0A6A6KRG3_HEVBR|nr:hypothetical protein GH714_020174 [Hevea brasiliensis]